MTIAVESLIIAVIAPASAVTMLMLFGLVAGLLMAAVIYEREPATNTGDSGEHQRRGEANPRTKRALIIGTGVVGQTLARNLTADPRYTVVGFADDEDCPTAELADRILGTREQTMELVRLYNIDEVFVAYAPTWQQRLAQDLAADGQDVKVQIVPSAYEALMRVDKVTSRGDIAVLRLNTEAGWFFDFMKRVVDILVAIIGSILVAPVALLVALAIRLTSRGPVIFAQERVGQYGRSFILYKFRTMVDGAESQTGPILSNGKRDSRVTPLGRILRATRLDELPQLWNVLKGDMSLVGPRPERPHFVRKYEREIPSYAQRHLVRPGITGLAQVHGTYHTDARDKLRFDLIYVSHRSWLLDANVMLRTAQVVMSSRGS